MSSKSDLGGVQTQPAIDRVYSNKGNTGLLDLLDSNFRRVLDVGCGAGDNAVLLKARNVECDIFGVTHSAAEAELVAERMSGCWVMDVEGKFPDDLENQQFDVLIFSHVLEHLRDPAEVLSRFSRLLRKGGQVLIAVPNILNWKLRLQFLRGDFRYRSSGPLDDTHLHFYTYFTAKPSLLGKAPELQPTDHLVTGAVPLWWLRRYLLPKKWSSSIDHWGFTHWPNLFGDQILIRAVRQ